MTAKTKVAQRKLSMLQLAEKLRNVSEACRIMGLFNVNYNSGSATIIFPVRPALLSAGGFLPFFPSLGGFWIAPICSSGG